MEQYLKNKKKYELARQFKGVDLSIAFSLFIDIIKLLYRLMNAFWEDYFLTIGIAPLLGGVSGV